MFLGKATTPEGLRLYAIGDIHGCDALLAEVHERIAADLAARPAADHRVVHIGDYVDRGPDSAGVIDRLASLAASDGRIICLRGNHDQMMLDFIDDPAAWGRLWLDNGGGATLSSYGISPDRFGLVHRRGSTLARDLAGGMPPEHLAFLLDLDFSARFGDYLFVHAGIRPGVPLDMQDPQDLIWIRDAFLFDGRDHGFVVVHGHTPANQPEVRPNRINVDTGAVFGGPLTCLVLEGTAHRFL